MTDPSRWLSDIEREAARSHMDPSLPVSGEQHERAVEAASNALREVTYPSLAEPIAEVALTAAYRIDMPRREAEVRAATLREVEALRERLTTMNECVRIYVNERETGIRGGWLEEEIAATDALLAANPEANDA